VPAVLGGVHIVVTYIYIPYDRHQAESDRYLIKRLGNVT